MVTTDKLVKMFRERLANLQSARQKIDAEISSLKAAFSDKGPVQVTRTKVKRSKGGHSPQAVSQFGRRYKEAIKARDTARAREFETKLNKAGAIGKAKLKEIREALMSRKSKPKAKAVSKKASKPKAAAPVQAAA
jgi:hypothetical protein